MFKFTLAEQIIAFAGTSVGGAIVGAWINREKDNVQILLSKQGFYAKLVKDVEDRRNAEKAEAKETIEKLTKEVHEGREDIKQLKQQIFAFIELNEKKDRIIEEKNNTLTRYEKHAAKQERIIKEQTEQISKVFKKLQQYEG